MCKGDNYPSTYTASKTANMSTKSPQRQTADRLITAFNSMDIDTIVSLRTETATRHIIPSTLGHAPQNNSQYKAHLDRLKPIFSNFNLSVQDTLEDREAGRICMWLTARADTLAGEYVNEYMWTLEFDGSGEKVAKSTEFVDTVMNRDFWPRLQAAMKKQREEQQGGGDGSSS